MHQYKIGDKVIGNEEADAHYGITVTGWIGKVVAIDGYGGIEVEGWDSERGYTDRFWVDPRRFDPYPRRPKGIVRKLPDWF